MTLSLNNRIMLIAKLRKFLEIRVRGDINYISARTDPFKVPWGEITDKNPMCYNLSGDFTPIRDYCYQEL